MSGVDRPVRIRVERPAEGVCRVTLAWPERRNAQDRNMLYALNDAFDEAMADDEVRVVILAADGPHFSSGHDLDLADSLVADDNFAPVSAWSQLRHPGVAGWYAAEQELFLQLCWRWRNLPKPTIAQIQGKVIGGGLMLVWPCDLVVAARSASFIESAVAMGCNGGELFVHPWELGHRKAKELLFTGEPMTATEAQALGMVNRVVEDDELETATLKLASRVALQPPFAITLAKQSVNHALDVQGQWAAVEHAFALHQLGHANNRLRHGGSVVDPEGARRVRQENRARRAE